MIRYVDVLQVKLQGMGMIDILVIIVLIMILFLSNKSRCSPFLKKFSKIPGIKNYYIPRYITTRAA